MKRKYVKLSNKGLSELLTNELVKWPFISQHKSKVQLKPHLELAFSLKILIFQFILLYAALYADFRKHLHSAKAANMPNFF